MDDKLHNEFLNNSNADFQGKILTFEEYLKLDYQPDEALKMAGLQIADIDRDQFLRLYYLTAKKKLKQK